MTILKNAGLLAILLYMVFGCNPQSRYRTLSIFFDGVPDPHKKSVTDSMATDSLLVMNSENKAALKKIRPWVIHDAYSNETCGDCHDQSLAYALIEPLPDLCYQCHDDFTEQYETIHAPVDDGDCTECHNPHKSRNAALLIVPKNEICTDCHDIEDILENDTHEDIEPGDCLDCHNPHGGEEFLL